MTRVRSTSITHKRSEKRKQTASYQNKRFVSLTVGIPWFLKIFSIINFTEWNFAEKLPQKEGRISQTIRLKFKIAFKCTEKTVQW